LTPEIIVPTSTPTPLPPPVLNIGSNDLPLLPSLTPELISPTKTPTHEPPPPPVLKPIYKDDGIRLHEDWFSIRYDEVRDASYIKTKDNFGPGEGLKTSDDIFKVSISAIVNGKTFDPKTPIKVSFSFSRMAGIKTQSQDYIFGANREDVWKPYHGNQLFILNDCKDVLFILSSGEKIQVMETDISYKPTNSSGFMGEQYQWETLTIKCNLDLLEKLKDGAKGALCDESFQFNKDTLSQIRTILSLLDDLRSRD